MSESPLPSDPRPGGFARRSPLTRRRVLGAGTALAAGAIAPGLFGSAPSATAAMTIAKPAAEEAGHSAAPWAARRCGSRAHGHFPAVALPQGP